jgi:hypothetical protein
MPLDDEIDWRRRSLLPVEVLEECERLVRELDGLDSQAGWGSLDRADVIANAPLFMTIIDQRRYCAGCTGWGPCSRNPTGPKGTIASHLTMDVDGQGHVTVRPFYKNCGPKQAALSLTPAPSKPRRRGWKGLEDAPF